MYLRILLIAGLSAMCLPCTAQNDIFGNGGLFDQPAAAGAATQPSLDDDPLAEQLMGRSRRGNLQMAESISALARVARWPLVDQLLSNLPAKKLPQPTLAEMGRRIGPDVFLRIRQQPEISPAALAALDQLGKATIAEAESPQRLRRAIAALTSKSIDDRLAAARTLLRGGNAAIAELVAAAVSETDAGKRDEILRVLMRLGDGGTEALRQLACYGTPAARTGAIESLGRIDPDGFVLEYLTAVHASDASEAEAAAAAALLGRLTPNLPSRGEAIAILSRDLNDKLEAAEVIENNDQVIMLWSVNPDRTGVTYQPTRVILSLYRNRADAAVRLRRIGGMSTQMIPSLLAADLAYRVMIDPDWGDPKQVEQVHASFAAAANESTLLAAIEQSISQADDPAAIGLLRWIGTDPSSFNPDQLLRSGGSSLTPLVNAAIAGEPRIRFEAALVATQLAGRSAYPGSSLVRHTLGEMASLGDKPTALLVETRPEVVVHLEGLLTSIGYHVEVVTSVAKLQKSMHRGGDIRLILSKTQLIDLSPIELVDTVRRMPRSRNVPILFYGDEPVGLVDGRWNAPTLQIDFPSTTAAFYDVLELVQRSERLPPLSIVDRQSFRSAATQWLAK